MAGQSTPHSNSPTSTVAPQAASSSTAPAAADSHPPPLTPDLSLEFPRIDYKIGWKYYTGVCFAAHQSHLECVGAARRASKVWRQSIEDTAKRTGRTIEETKVAVDDLCFALAVFDKVWEVHYWVRADNVPYQKPTRTYKEWYWEYDYVIRSIYKLACTHFDERYIPPTEDRVYNLVRRCLYLWVSKYDVCDPPTIRFAAFDLSLLGPYASQYHEHSEIVLQDHESSPGNYVKEVVTVPGNPSPFIVPPPTLKSSLASLSTSTTDVVKATTPAEQTTKHRNDTSAEQVDDAPNETPPASNSTATPASVPNQPHPPAVSQVATSDRQTKRKGRSKKSNVTTKSKSTTTASPSTVATPDATNATDVRLRPRRVLTPISLQ